MTQKQRVLAMLEQGPQTTGSFLEARIPRFSARIDELRLEGYTITSRQVRQGSWAYELTGTEERMVPVLDYTQDEPIHGFRPLSAVIKDFKLETANRREEGRGHPSQESSEVSATDGSMTPGLVRESEDTGSHSGARANTTQSEVRKAESI